MLFLTDECSRILILIQCSSIFSLQRIQSCFKLMFKFGCDLHWHLKVHIVLMGSWSTAWNSFARKNGRHNLSFARHHSSKCHLFCQLVENKKSSAIHVFQAVSLLDKKILTAQIVTGRQRFWKMSTARHNL